MTISAKKEKDTHCLAPGLVAYLKTGKNTPQVYQYLKGTGKSLKFGFMAYNESKK